MHTSLAGRYFIQRTGGGGGSWQSRNRLSINRYLVCPVCSWQKGCQLASYWCLRLLFLSVKNPVAEIRTSNKVKKGSLRTLGRENERVVQLLPQISSHCCLDLPCFPPLCDLQGIIRTNWWHWWRVRLKWCWAGVILHIYDAFQPRSARSVAHL